MQTQLEAADKARVEPGEPAAPGEDVRRGRGIPDTEGTGYLCEGMQELCQQRDECRDCHQVLRWRPLAVEGEQENTCLCLELAKLHMAT